MIHYHNKILGSQLIGQSFKNTHYFWGRPSATSLFPYNAALSSGSNLGPSNPALLNAVKMRIAALQKSDPKKQSSIPVDLVTASASGLDPDISPLAALYQAPRIAKARKIPEEKIIKLIQQLTKKRDFGILGEPRINVLQLNMALDNL